MHTDFLSSNAQHHQQTPVGSLLIAIGVLILATGCTQAAGLHEHEAYRGFPDSRSKVLCSTGGSMSPLRVPCIEALDASPQDGHLENSRPEYTVEGNDIHDSITGLVWRKQATTAKNYSDSVKACDSLDGNYRLPSRLELISLLDYGGSKILIDTAFEGMEDTFYRSSTVYKSTDPQFRNTHWVVNFAADKKFPMDGEIPPGETIGHSDDNPTGVLCVRSDSGPYISGPFEPSGVENRFRRDTRTGLLWLAKPLDEVSWKEAILECSAVRDGGYLDNGQPFRLPNAKEIGTLVDDNASAEAAIKLHPGFDLPHKPDLWSSTPMPNALFALILSSSGASITEEATVNDYHSALCVRGPD